MEQQGNNIWSLPPWRVTNKILSAALRRCFNASARKDRTGYVAARSYGLGHELFKKVVTDFILEAINHGKSGTFYLPDGIYEDGLEKKTKIKGDRSSKNSQIKPV
jgi:hypothetical protein